MRTEDPREQRFRETRKDMRRKRWRKNCAELLDICKLILIGVSFLFLWYIALTSLTDAQSFVQKLLTRILFTAVIVGLVWISSFKPRLHGRILFSAWGALVWAELLPGLYKIILLLHIILMWLCIAYEVYLVFADREGKEIFVCAIVLSATSALNRVRLTYVNWKAFHFWEISLAFTLIIAAILFTLWINGKLGALSEREGVQLAWCLGLIFLALLLMFSTMTRLNYALDRNEPTLYPATIVEKERDSGRPKSPTTYRFHLIIDGDEYELKVPISVYSDYEVGDTFEVEICPGAFGRPYIIAAEKK